MSVITKPGYVNEHEQWWRVFADGRRTRAFLAICRYCRQRFTAYRAEEFCSRSCSAKSRGQSPALKRRCPFCREMFDTRDKRQVFCSHSCAAQSAQSEKPSTTSGVARNRIKNAGNPRFTRDDQGQWWYRPLSGSAGRTRAFLLRCAECDSYYLADVQHVKKQQFCSRSCGIRVFRRKNPDRWKGDRSARWKGGTTINRNGYVMQWAVGHPDTIGTTKRYLRRCRLVMEEKLGRRLAKGEQVHHINGIRDDDRPENLELWVTHQPSGQRATEQKHCPTCTCGRTQ